jgi:hypothetical protein
MAKESRVLDRFWALHFERDRKPDPAMTGLSGRSSHQKRGKPSKMSVTGALPAGKKAGVALT